MDNPNPNPSEKSLNVLMLPWLAHGHVNPCLELAKRLTNAHPNLSIHFCSTPVMLQSIRRNLPPLPQSRISLVELHLPEQPDLPPHLHTTKHLPTHLLPTLIRTFEQSQETFAHLLDTLKPDFLIFDIFQPWAAKAAQERNIPTAVYIGCTVAMAFYAHDYFANSKEFPFPAITLTQDNRRPRSNPAVQQQAYRRFVERVVLCWQLSDFVITRSFREVESKYMDYFSSIIGKELVTTGPLIPDVGVISTENSQEAEKVLHWLDQREKRSVVYVSLGSEWFMPYNEMEQLARGLELSGACFIWVARFPKNDANGEESESETANMSAKALLTGLVERVGPDKGLVVTSWAPQRQILHHQNVGCFLTHCGWSSIIEATEAGVPMLALPMDWDQPINAKLIVEHGISIEIPQRGLGNFRGEDVSACIQQMFHSQQGASVRKNAQDLAEVIRTRQDNDMQILVDKIARFASKTSTP